MPFKTKEQPAAYMREWRAKNPEKHRASVRKWKANNWDKHKEYLAGYRKRKRGKFTAHEAKRRAEVMRAVPVWLTPEQQKEIFEIYDRAGKLPGDEVDHIPHIFTACLRPARTVELTDHTRQAKRPEGQQVDRRVK